MLWICWRTGLSLHPDRLPTNVYNTTCQHGHAARHTSLVRSPWIAADLSGCLKSQAWLVQISNCCSSTVFQSQQAKCPNSASNFIQVSGKTSWNCGLWTRGSLRCNVPWILSAVSPIVFPLHCFTTLCMNHVLEQPALPVITEDKQTDLLHKNKWAFPDNRDTQNKALHQMSKWKWKGQSESVTSSEGSGFLRQSSWDRPRGGSFVWQRGGVQADHVVLHK